MELRKQTTHPSQKKPNHSVVAVEWYMGADVVGFVLVQTRGGKLKCYIGCGAGGGEHLDTMYIVTWGVRLENEVAKAMFPSFKEFTWAD